MSSLKRAILASRALYGLFRTRPSVDPIRVDALETSHPFDSCICGAVSPDEASLASVMDEQDGISGRVQLAILASDNAGLKKPQSIQLLPSNEP